MGAELTGTLLSCIWIAIEVSSLLLFDGAFLKRRLSAGWTLAVMLAFYIVSVINDLGFFFALSLTAQKVFNLSAGILTALLLFDAPWYACLAVTVSWYFYLGAIDTISVYGAAALLGMSLSALMEEVLVYSILVTVEKIICLVLCWGIFLLRRGQEERSFSGKRFLLMTLFPVVSFYGLFQLYLNTQSQSEMSLSVVVFSAVLIIANGAVFYLMNSLERTVAAEKEIALLNQSKALQTESYYALEKSYRAQRAASHEFKHQLQLIGDLLRDGHTDEARKYIDQLQGQQTARLFAANTGNAIVDAILNEKYQRSREQGIDIRYRVSDLSALSIDTDALVVLLANLLDNAIEACVRLPSGRIIECSLVLEDSLLLSIRNTSPPVQIRDGRIETSKAPRSEHGYGLIAVQRILAHLGGEVVLDYSEPWFQVVAEIPN